MLHKFSFTTRSHLEDRILECLSAKKFDPIVEYNILNDGREVAYELGDSVNFSFYLPVDRSLGEKELAPLLADLRRLDPEILEVARESVDEIALRKNWENFFQPMPVGEDLLIIPYQRGFIPPSGRRPLWLEPGLAFGSGGHETTSLCLEILSELKVGLPPSARFLDCGCGTGILACAMGLWGFHNLTALDLEAEAIQASQANFELNGILGVTLVQRGIEVYRPGPIFDLVAANIQLDVLAANLPILANLLRPGGRVIFSGILTENLPGLFRSLAAFPPLKQLKIREKNEWCAMILERTGVPI